MRSKERLFQPNQFIGTEVKGKLLVTVGYGKVGKKIIEMAKGLGMETKYSDVETTPEELDTLISEADVLVLSLSLNSQTKGLIDIRRLSLMKKDSIIINISRGLVVEQEALYEMLKNGKIAGAGLDVFVVITNIIYY